MSTNELQSNGHKPTGEHATDIQLSSGDYVSTSDYAIITDEVYRAILAINGIQPRTAHLNKGDKSGESNKVHIGENKIGMPKNTFS